MTEKLYLKLFKKIGKKWYKQFLNAFFTSLKNIRQNPKPFLEKFIPQISKMVSDFDLEFLGFSNEQIKKRYSIKLPEDEKNILLENWDKFETSEPGTFIDMYNFWLRKKVH